MERGGGTVELGVWGDVAPRGLVADETRRRRLSPAFARPPCAASSSSSPSWSSLTWLPVGAPLIDRPPGRLLDPGGGAPMVIGPDARLRGVPTGMDEGREPWGALRHA